MVYSSSWQHIIIHSFPSAVDFCWTSTTNKAPSACIICVSVSRCCALWSLPGQELEVKLIRDRHRGIVAGYGFIDFRNHETAQLVLDSLNGKPIGKITRDGKGGGGNSDRQRITRTCTLFMYIYTGTYIYTVPI